MFKLKKHLLFNQFSQDISDLWLSLRQGHMIEWEYTDSSYKNDPAGGSAFWALTEKHAHYYMHQEEAALIKNTAKDIADIVYPSTCLVEFGPGQSSKILPLLQAIYPLDVIGVDLSYCSLESFCNLIKGKNISLVETQEADFLYSPPQFDKKSIIISMGGTFFNTPMTSQGGADYNAMIALLKRWRQSMTKGGYILIGQDTNNDPETLHAAYNQPYIKAMTESVWHRAAKELDLINFNPYSMKYKGVWDAHNKVFKHTVASKYDQTIYLDGMHFNLKAGQEYCQSNSFKLSSEDMRDMIKAAGMTPVKTWKSPQGRMILHLMAI